jgi:hypothetical protein
MGDDRAVKRAASFIKKVQTLGVSLSANGTRLVIGAPSGVITRELREQFLQLKPAILAELNAGAVSHTTEAHPSGAIREVATLLALAYRRYQAGNRDADQRAGGGDSRLANSGQQSVHGGYS